jgi:GNAT superfamily N-acetyltransferase
MSEESTAISIRKLDSTDEETILKIARWYLEEWNIPTDKTIQRLKNQPSEDIIFQLVLYENNKAVATGGLYNQVGVLQVHEHLKKYGPWVAVLYVDKSHRNNGLGEMLLNEIEQCARKNNRTKIYLYTFTAEALYKRCGWKEIERVVYKGHDTVVMEKDLT